MIYTIHGFWNIVLEFEDEFMDSLSRHKITTVKRDFSNLFFAYFIRNMSRIFQQNKATKIVYRSGILHLDLCKHFYSEELEVFFDRFYRKISRLFPSVFFEHDFVDGMTLNGTYLAEDLPISVFEKIVQLGPKNTSFDKIEREMKKRLGRLKEDIRIQNFHSL